MKVERILAGVDLGLDTERVLAYAAHFAKVMDASLHALFVIDYLVTPPSYLAPYIEEEKKIAEERFAALKKGVEAYGVPMQAEVAVGRLHESFDAAVRKIGADMLVLGFRSHAFRRSSSEKLIKGLEIPLLVVRGERADLSQIGSIRIGKILCPTDFSGISRGALKAATELRERFHSELVVMHVVPSHVLGERMEAGEDKERARQELLALAREEMTALEKDFGIEKPGVIVEGEPHREIASFSADEGAGLVVMGARGLSFIKGMLIGSVTDAVLKSSSCPVFVIH